MSNQATVSQKDWFLPARLASYIIIFSVVVVWMGYPKYLNFQFILYSVFTLGFTLTILLKQRFHLPMLIKTLILLQFLLEISLESGVIYVTGNIHSSFSALFLLTIVSASLVYRLVGTLMIASAVSLAYTFIIWLGLGSASATDLSLRAIRSVFLTDESAFYSILLHLLIFYLVAFIAGYLAQRLRTQGILLADTSLALRRAKLETDDILRHLNSGLLTVDATGHVIFFNHAAERILGYREEDVRGLLCSEVFSERMPMLAESMKNCLRGTTESRTEFDIVDRQGQTIPLGLSSSLLTDDSHTPRGVIGIFSDLTEAKQLEQKVRAADRHSAVGEMSASMAHEIRNPLAAISGSVEVLSKELKLSGENARLMALIIKESSRLNNILSEFLTYARIGRPSYNKVELCHLIGEVVGVLNHHPLLHRDTIVEIQSRESCVYVVGDEDLLKQLLVNLAHNACESFDGEPGEIRFKLESRPNQNQVLLEIEDNGPGISPEVRGKVYQPFFSTKRQGTGLGLAIVHRACDLMNLGLSFISEPGQGTTFSILFTGYQVGSASPLPELKVSEKV